MKICFELRGFGIDNGLESGHGTEGRWASEWARLLASKGHSCDLLVNSFSVGQYPFPDRINTVSEILGKEYDVFFIVGADIKPWHIDVKTKLSISLIYSDPGRNELERALFSKPNHIIGAQTERMKKFCVKESSPFYTKTRNVPTPMAEKMSPGRFDNNYYLLPQKYQPREDYLYAMIHFLKKHKIKLGVLNDYWIKPMVGPRMVGDQTVLSIFEELKVDYFNLMPKIEADHILERSKCIFTSGARGGLYPIEAVVAGVLPFPTDSTEFYFEEADDILYPGFHKKDDPTNYQSVAESICEVWEEPYRDRDFYNKALKLYQESVSHHLYDNAYKLFLDITKDFI